MSPSRVAPSTTKPMDGARREPHAVDMSGDPTQPRLAGGGRSQRPFDHRSTAEHAPGRSPVPVRRAGRRRPRPALRTRRAARRAAAARRPSGSRAGAGTASPRRAARFRPSPDRGRGRRVSRRGPRRASAMAVTMPTGPPPAMSARMSASWVVVEGTLWARPGRSRRQNCAERYADVRPGHAHRRRRWPPLGTRRRACRRCWRRAGPPSSRTGTAPARWPDCRRRWRPSAGSPARAW